MTPLLYFTLGFIIGCAAGMLVVGLAVMFRDYVNR